MIETHAHGVRPRRQYRRRAPHTGIGAILQPFGYRLREPRQPNHSVDDTWIEIRCVYWLVLQSAQQQTGSVWVGGCLEDLARIALEVRNCSRHRRRHLCRRIHPIRPSCH